MSVVSISNKIFSYWIGSQVIMSLLIFLRLLRYLPMFGFLEVLVDSSSVTLLWNLIFRKYWFC
jgi:hypothetical protein